MSLEQAVAELMKKAGSRIRIKKGDTEIEVSALNNELVFELFKLVKEYLPSK